MQRFYPCKGCRLERKFCCIQSKNHESVSGKWEYSFENSYPVYWYIWNREMYLPVWLVFVAKPLVKTEGSICLCHVSIVLLHAILNGVKCNYPTFSML